MPLVIAQPPKALADFYAKMDSVMRSSAAASPFQLPAPLQNFLVDALDFLTPSTEEEVITEMAMGIMPDPANLSFALKGLSKMPIPQIDRYIRRGAKQAEEVLEGSQDALGLLETRFRGVRGDTAADSFRANLDTLGTPSAAHLDDISQSLQLETLVGKTDDLVFPSFGNLRSDAQATFMHPSVEAKGALFRPEAIRPGGGTVSLGPDVMARSTDFGTVTMEEALRHELTHGISGSVPGDIKKKVLSEVSFDNPLPRARRTPQRGATRREQEFTDLTEMFSEFGEGAIPASKLPAGLEFFEQIMDMLFETIPNRPGVSGHSSILTPDHIIRFGLDIDGG